MPPPAQRPESPRVPLPENSTPVLRHLVSGSFLNRINDILANIWNLYSQEMLSDRPGPRDAAHSIPVRIQYLASRTRMGGIPDLPLDMNFALDSNVLTDTLLSGRARHSPSHRLASVFPPDNLRHICLWGEVDADDDTADEDEEDYAEEANDEDEDEDDDDDDDDDDDEVDDDEDDILVQTSLEASDDDEAQPYSANRFPNSRPRGSDAQLNAINVEQRLLLSSASQNPTNQNTLIPPSIHSGVPLRRQNAIRMQNFHLSKPRAKTLSKALYEEFSQTMAAISRKQLFTGQSPVFANHVHCDHRNSPLVSWTALRRCRRSSIEQHMDLFLQTRRLGNLWSLDHLSPRAKLDINRKPLLKRKSATKSEAHKRRKRSNHPTGAHPNLVMSMITLNGQYLNIRQLSASEKYRILGVLPCLDFRDGSVYQFQRKTSDKAFASLRKISIQFAQVDYVNMKVHGSIGMGQSSHPSLELRLLLNYLSFLYGAIRSKSSVASEGLLSKVLVLQELILYKEDVLLGSSSTLALLNGAVNVPFSGSLIDFDKFDLRYMEEAADQTSKNTSTKLRSEFIRAQLKEWLHVEPFKNLNEMFFMSYLKFVCDTLKNFEDLPRSDQEPMLKFARNMKDLALELIKDLEFLRNAKLPIVKEKSPRERSATCPAVETSPIKTPFLLEWEAKLCDKLCDYITCTDACLLNLQLNYLLFTIDVDVPAAIDHIFHELLHLILDTLECKKFRDRYAAIGKAQDAAHEVRAVFVCSLNRKTGVMEMRKTRLYFKSNGYNRQDAWHSEVDFAESDIRSRETSRQPQAPSGDGKDQKNLEDLERESAFSSFWGVQKRGSSGSFSYGARGDEFTFV